MFPMFPMAPKLRVTAHERGSTHLDPTANRYPRVYETEILPPHITSHHAVHHHAVRRHARGGSERLHLNIYMPHQKSAL